VRNKAREGALVGEQNLPRFKAESAGGGIDARKFLRKRKLMVEQRLGGSYQHYMAMGL